jgi:hypothetical protein
MLGTLVRHECNNFLVCHWVSEFRSSSLVAVREYLKVCQYTQASAVATLFQLT